VLLLDGGGSAMPADRATPKRHYFDAQKAFAEELIRHSLLTNTSAAHSAAEEDANAGRGARFGLVVFGGAELPRVASLLSGDAQELSRQLYHAVMPAGQTSVAQALHAAARVFQLSVPAVTDVDGLMSPRHKTVLLITDGQALRPGSFVPAARELRAAGTRVAVALVRTDDSLGFDGAATALCEVASWPCADHVFKVKRWEDLKDQYGRFLAALCPASE